jgi:hypothetical protein
MTLIATYEFTLKDGEVIRGATLYTELRQHDRQPEFPGSNIRCDLERVEVIVTSDSRFTPKIFWSDEVFGTNGNAQLMREDREGVPLDIALLEIREGQTWIMRSEPTMDDRIGITISNDKGKVLFTGLGDLTPVEYTPLRPDLKPKQGNIFTFSFSEVYKWRRSSPFSCGHTSGADRKESPAVYPDYSAPDGGTR